MDIINLPIGNDLSVDLSATDGVVKLAVELKLLPLLKSIRAASTNAVENAILDVAISALEALAPAAPVAPGA